MQERMVYRRVARELWPLERSSTGGGCIDRPSFYGGRVCCGRTPTGLLEPVGLRGEVISASVTFEKNLVLIDFRPLRRVGCVV